MNILYSKRGRAGLKPAWFMWGSQKWVACHTMRGDEEFIYTGVQVKDIEGELEAVLKALPSRERNGPHDKKGRKYPQVMYYDTTVKECRSDVKKIIKPKPVNVLPAAISSDTGMKDLGI